MFGAEAKLSWLQNMFGAEARLSRLQDLSTVSDITAKCLLIRQFKFLLINVKRFEDEIL